jgi:stress response protein SCP2
VDLACCAFSDEGQLIDAAYHSQTSALGGAVRHCGDNALGARWPTEDSEVIHVVPALVPEHCCLLMFTLSSEDLHHCEALVVTCYAKERGKEKVRISLSP